MAVRQGQWPKIIRAEEHLAAIRAEIDFYREANPYRVVGKFDDASHYLVRVEERYEPPIRLAMLIGECLNALRSSLDHLAYALVAKWNPAALARPHDISFPLDREERQSKRKPVTFGPLDRIPEGCFALVKAAQPHDGGDIGTHPLAVLRELTNIDKHRQLLLGQTFLDGLLIQVRCSDVVVRQQTIVARLVHGAQAARFDLTTDEVLGMGGVSIEDVKVDAYGGLSVAFDEPQLSYSAPVLDALEQCKGVVLALVDAIGARGGLM